ncbi:MAG: AAA family ATPase [Clostridia bacterium]|nr:AAA family ATPase [Clostridia bacterium]
MYDCDLGNFIFRCRVTKGISRSELAEKIGVTEPDISDWERGKKKPDEENLKKLASVFKVSEERIMSIGKKNKQSITTIVLTGGPCAGKSTAMSRIQSTFTKMGYTVLIVPETATELITGGVAPDTCGTVLDYERLQMRLQLEKEAVFVEAAKTMDSDRVLIVCDRGNLDVKAYMSETDFSLLIDDLGTNETELRDNYDAVFHLVTTAKGAEQFYTTSNNAARRETPQEAALVDDKLIAAWTGHPHFRVIDNSTDFDNKIRRLMVEISSFLGEPEPFEIERKFLIEYPDIEWLDSIPNCKKVDIIQTYLKTDREDEEVRIRQRGVNGNYIYFHTTKRRISGIKRIETEQKISEGEYLRLLMEADTTKRQLRKNRYCLMYDNQYFEIDVYPFWNDKAILEIELSDENSEIRFPKQIKIIKEVTYDDSYKNSSLAASAHAAG